MKFLKASCLIATFPVLVVMFLGLLTLSGLPARGGSEGGTALNGDVNCDNRVDIADAIALITWQFGGGPKPCALAQDNFATRADLNALSTRVAALEALNRNDAKVASGTYTGDGTASRAVPTGLAGKLRYLSIDAIDSGIAATVTDQTHDPNLLIFNGADFVIPNVQLNTPGTKYAWIALSGVDGA